LEGRQTISHCFSVICMAAVADRQLAEQLSLHIASLASEKLGIRKENIPAVEGAFILRNALDKEECRELFNTVKQIHTDFGRLNPKVELRRDSQIHIPVNARDYQLNNLESRLRKYLPTQAGPENPSTFNSISHFLRTYCYESGDSSCPHWDRSFRVTSDTGRLEKFSGYSVVIYLGDNFEGGTTNFFQSDPTLVISKKGNTPLVNDWSCLNVVCKVKPVTGDILLFPHGNESGCFPDPLHEGGLIHSGTKCIIRTDLVFDASNAPKRIKTKRKNTFGIAKAVKNAAADIRTAVAIVCPAYIGVTESSIRLSNVPSGPEIECTIVGKIFWDAFKLQRTGSVGVNTVNLVSDFGLSKSYSIEQLLDAVLANIPTAHSFAYIGRVGCRIRATSKEFASLQQNRGLSMCVECGKFVQQTGGGLEWHLKKVHQVSSHEQAYEAVKSVSAALVASRENNDHVPVARLVSEDMDMCIHHAINLSDLVSKGKIKSLGGPLDSCRAGDIDSVKSFIKDGWDAKISVDKNGSSGLLWAAGFGHIDVCKYLVDEIGVDPVSGQTGRRGYNKRTPLHWSARNGQFEIVKWLLEEKKVQVDPLTEDGSTPFCLAAFQGHVEICKYLVIEAKANAHVCNSYGCTAGMWACQGPNASVELMQMLQEFQIDMTSLNDNGQGCLHKAAQRGNEDVCKWLVENVTLGKEHFMPNHAERSPPSQLAYFSGNTELANWLSKLENEL